MGCTQSGVSRNVSSSQNSLSARGLVGYAVLRANFNHSAPSYVDNFTSFVLDALASRAPTMITETTAGAAIREAFGFTIPDKVVGTLLRRAVRKGQATQNGNEFGLTSSQLADVPTLQSDIAVFERQQQELLNKYVAFAKQMAPEHAELVTNGSPAGHIQDFIEKNTVPLLSTAIQGRNLNAPHWRALEGPEYVVAAFVQHLAEHDNTTFGYLVGAVKGAILAAVLDMGTGNLTQRLGRLNLILDTPVMLKALGYQGPSQQQAVVQMIELAHALDAKVVCFEHTVREADGVLEAAQAVLRSGGRSTSTRREVDSYFLDQGFSAADVEIERGKLQQRLQSLRITILNRPDDYYKYGLDETELETVLQTVVGYRSETTRNYDVQSLSAIHRLRHGESPAQFERCGFVLVTDNGSLVKASSRLNSEKHVFPLAMLDNVLAGLLWVRSPAIADDLPRQQLIATAYAGMQPGSHLWAKYLGEIERLQSTGVVDSDEAFILRARPEARRALMDVTLGEASDLDGDAITTVVERVRAELVAPIRDEALAAAEQRDHALEQARLAALEGQSKDAELQQQLERQQALSAEVSGLASQLGNLQIERERQHTTLQDRARRRAHQIVHGSVYIVCAVLIVLGSLKYAAPTLLSRMPTWVAIAALVAVVAIFALGGIRHFTGGSVREWLKPLEVRLAKRLHAKYRRGAGLSPAGETDDENVG